MSLQSIEIETGKNPAATIIVMHGLGADANDFVPFTTELDLHRAGAVRFVFPSAPVLPVTINGGYRMPAWYDILGTDLSRKEDEAGLRKSHSAIDMLIEREKERGIAASRIVVGGFSQGCAMALMTGIRHKEKLGGIIGMSGYLPLAALAAAEASPASRGTPIFLAHGTHDPVVPLAGGVASRDALRALGYDVEWHEYPMAHSVCAPEVADLAQWLNQVLAPAA